LLTNIAYHSQIDDQSERINQIIEIALRYLLISNSNLSWHETLSTMQQTFMNTITFIEYSLNQTLYQMNIRSLITLLVEDFRKNQQQLREIIRKNVVDVINFVNARVKIVYDDKHKSFAFNIEDKIYLWLHNEYFLLEKENLKLSNQRFDSYTVKRKINNVVYELNLSLNTRIHSIISITQLKSAKDDSDSYNRSRSTNSESVEIKDDTSIKRSFEIEKILKKRNKRYDKTKIIQYLIKWLKWESEHNSWMSRKNCENATNLITKSKIEWMTHNVIKRYFHLKNLFRFFLELLFLTISLSYNFTSIIIFIKIIIDQILSFYSLHSNVIFISSLSEFHIHFISQLNIILS
jgi:hypothetical protein